MVACGLFCSNFDDENLKESVTKFIPLAYFFEIQYFKFDEFAGSRESLKSHDSKSLEIELLFIYSPRRLVVSGKFFTPLKT